MSDTPTPRAVLIRALHDAGAWCGQCDFESDEPCEDCDIVLAKYADAGLAALAASAGPLTAQRLAEIRRRLDASPYPDVLIVRDFSEVLTAYTALAAECARLREECDRRGKELAIAGVEGSPPPWGQGTIPALLQRAHEAENHGRQLESDLAALRATVGFTTDKEHRRGCPALSAWDIPGACDCDYPTVTRCNQCGARTPTPEGQG